MPPEAVYAATIRSQYVLAPRGTGVDTHRFYEAIYLRSVPIVVRTNSAFDRLYTVFPCLLVAERTDVTAELLDREYEACAYKLHVFHYRYPRFLTDRATISDLRDSALGGLRMMSMRANMNRSYYGAVR